ncbi:MAG: sigma-70 family RNA polymerase sigma factor [Verrucomicrobiales bacterium]
MKATFARTRLSLIERLANWEDQRTWDEFYQTYWRLIFSVSLKSGLSSEEAMDVVQETVLAIAKQWKDGQRYDPAKGSFKTWLMNITCWRIADQPSPSQKSGEARSAAGGGRAQGHRHDGPDCR